MTQMEQWSILNNVLNYIQYDKHQKNNHYRSINAVNKYKNSLDTSEGKRQWNLTLVSHQKYYGRNI